MFKTLFLFFSGLLFSLSVLAQSTSEMKMGQYFEAIKSNPDKLYAFLKAMPKGGDLHNHLAGASYAEKMIDYAYND